MHTHFRQLLTGLRASGLSTLLACPDAPPGLVDKLSTDTLRIEPHPVNIRQARQQADLMVCPGGQGTLAAFLLAGVPVLAFPDHQEQSIQAGVAQINQCGVATLPPTADVAALLKRAASDPQLQAQAQAFAKRYSDYSMERQASALSDDLEKLVAGTALESAPTNTAWRS